VAWGHVPVATVNPESIRELYRESFRTRAQVQRGSMGRARCGTIACGLNVGDVSNVLLCARAQSDMTLTARAAHQAMRSGCPQDTYEISADYAGRNSRVNVSH